MKTSRACASARQPLTAPSNCAVVANLARAVPSRTTVEGSSTRSRRITLRATDVSVTVNFPPTACYCNSGFEWFLGMAGVARACVSRGDCGRVRVLQGNGFSARLTSLTGSIFWWIGPKRASTVR
jgi:hypothetical protein